MNARTLSFLLLAFLIPREVIADELPSRYPPPPLPLPTAEPPCCVGLMRWSGLYLGVQYGGAFSDPRWTFPFAESFNTQAGQNFSPSASGAILGGHLGINYQIHEHFLIGAEVSYVDNRLTSQTTGPIAAFPTDRFDIRASDLFMTVGRAGLIFGQYLFYGRAGYASSLVDVGANSQATGITGRASHRDGGWAIGGGLDGSIYSHVLFGLEYNYVSMPDGRLSASTTGAALGLPFTSDLGNFHMHTVTARLSFLFDSSFCCSHLGH